MHLPRRPAGVVPALQPKAEGRIEQAPADDEDLLGEWVAFPPKAAVSAPLRKRVRRVNSPVAGSSLSTSSCTWPSSPSSQRQRWACSGASGFQYVLVVLLMVG